MKDTPETRGLSIRELVLEIRSDVRAINGRVDRLEQKMAGVWIAGSVLIAAGGLSVALIALL